MFRPLLCILLYAVAGSQLQPLGPTPLPTGFTPAIPPLYTPTLPPTPIPFPFAPVPSVPGIPGVPGVAGVPPVPGSRNPYYNYSGLGPAVPILTYSNEGPNIDGSYAFSYSTADGKQVQESGFLKDAYIDNNGEPQGTQVVQGSYAYISPEGTPIQVSYIADENGFRPSGVHIPANGKGFLPPDVYNGNFTRGAFDPAFNRYTTPPLGYTTPYNANYRQPYNQPYNKGYNNPYYNNQYYNNPLAGRYNHPLANQYNNPLRYDPRYNQNAYTPNPYNPYRQGLYDAPYNNAGYKYDKPNKDTPKKD